MKSILIGGQAGQGVEKASEIVTEALRRIGYYSFNYRDYQSLIRGGHNFNVISFSKEKVFSNEWEYDVILALNDETAEKHKSHLKSGGIVILYKDYPQADEAIKELNLPPISKNSFFVGVLAKTIGMKKEVILSVVKESLGEKQLEIASRGYDAAETVFSIDNGKELNAFIISGSQTLGKAAIDAGLERFIGYPMTPATPVFHYIAAHQNEKLKAVQMENEIAVVHGVIAASYAGKMAMAATSSGGLALMGEACSLAGISETPLVINLAQRTGPATGLPTYTAQADLKMALNIGHGEFPRIVVAPGLPDEIYELTQEAFYLAYKYRTLAIILTDKHVAESQFTIEEFVKPKRKPEKFIIKADKNYAHYKITEDGLSPRAIPGEDDNVVVKATSYEHDEYSNTTEDPEMTVKMNDKRMRKMKTLEKEVMQLEPVKMYGNGSKVIVGWGSTKGAILDALRELDGYSYLQIRYLSPFPSKVVKEVLEKADEIVDVENNVTGQLADIIAEKTGIIVKKKVLKYDARPFSAKEIVEGVKHA